LLADIRDVPSRDAEDESSGTEQHVAPLGDHKERIHDPFGGEVYDPKIWEKRYTGEVMGRRPQSIPFASAEVLCYPLKEKYSGLD
jgi:hypothetical protein